jgi:pyridoxal 5'-phosphate synthase pdxT subunit
MSRVGVLAIQGNFAAHARMLKRIGVEAIEVRRADQLFEDGQNKVDGFIIPGGESTTMIKLLMESDMIAPIRQFARSGKPIMGTCAGAILLAHEVMNPKQLSLELIDISIERNAYGRQVDSHIRIAETQIEGGNLEAVFIRAPRIVRLGKNIEVLAASNGEPVFVRAANIFASTFHPELTTDERIHRYFVKAGCEVTTDTPSPKGTPMLSGA